MDIQKVAFKNVLDWRVILEERFIHLFRLFVIGIEVNQAVQYHDADEHLTDPADRGPDNSVRLVSGKPAWVRVHLGSLFGASGLDAELVVQRRVMGFLWATVATLSPDPSSATSVPGLGSTSYADRRGTLGRTVNFILPANHMIGTLRLRARVTSGTRTAESSTVVGVTLRQRLRLAGVMIAYDGPSSMAANSPNLTIAAPTLADLQAMSGTTLRLFPVESTADFRTAGNLTLTTHLQDTSFPTSGCGTNWNALHGQVANARTADGNRPGWIYYGLLPNGVPMGPVGGCGGGGVAVGPVQRAGTLAHEAGHACGLAHAPAGGAPNPDPNYPVYQPYASASIGEYGMNVDTGAVASPQTFRDFMAYGGPSWIGLHHYGRLLSNARLNPTTVGIDFPWWRDLVWEEVRRWPPFELREKFEFPPDLELPMFPPSRPQDVISVIVQITRGEVAEVRHVARTRVHTAMHDAAPTRFSARLLGKDGSVVASAPLQRLRTSAGCGCGDGDGWDGAGQDGGHDGGREPESYLAQAFVADVEPGSALEIAAGDDDVLWRRQAPGRSPEVRGGDTEYDEKADELHVRWDVGGEVEEFWLRWSADGETWRSLATGLQEPRAVLAGAAVPAGKGLLQVVAHDGFSSVHSEPFGVWVPDRAPTATVLHPVDGYTYVAGQTVRLLASVIETVRDVSDEAVWTVDGAEVAHGLDAFTTLEPGEPVVTVRVGEAEASVRVRVERLPSQDEWREDGGQRKG